MARELTRPASAVEVDMISARQCFSALFGAIACMYREALANQIADSSWTNVSFDCPAARDEEPGGTYSYFTAPLLPTDNNRNVRCEPR